MVRQWLREDQKTEVFQRHFRRQFPPIGVPSDWRCRSMLGFEHRRESADEFVAALRGRRGGG